MSTRISISRSTGSSSAQIDRLREALRGAKTVLIGAGAGMSTAAGFTYSGARFQKYFSDFAEKYGFRDMYSGGFGPFNSPEEHWAYWSRYIYINRCMPAPKPAYDRLFELVREKDYFVITTNVDHCFQRAGFDKNRLFYTQGDYGLFQCSLPCRQETWDNEAAVRAMLEAQGLPPSDDGKLPSVEEAAPGMTVPKELLPRCPHCSRSAAMNLRADDKFVEDAGWHRAAERYSRFLKEHADGELLLLELGVGYNTPVIIKYPFWRIAMNNSRVTYACVNFGEAACPDAIRDRAICIDGDIGETLAALLPT